MTIAAAMRKEPFARPRTKKYINSVPMTMQIRHMAMRLVIVILYPEETPSAVCIADISENMNGSSRNSSLK